MVWTAPKTQIRDLQGTRTFRQTQHTPGFVEFSAVCQGFDPGAHMTNFLFVRAGDLGRGLFSADTIPCQEIEFHDYEGEDGDEDEELQLVRFKASIHQREAGSYHLVGWCAADREAGGLMVNNSCVYEFAVTILALPPDELAEERHKAQRAGKAPASP